MATAVIIGLGTAFGIYATKLYYKGSICQARRDLTGQVAIITGGSTGIGRETALDLAKEHCTVVIAARDLKKLQQAADYIKQNSHNNNVEYKQLDLASRSSIDQFADDIKAKYSHVNILINNAGVAGFPKLTVNENNIEMQMAVNHFGHFYLTYLLWDVLKDSENLRIINVSSRAHMHNMIDSSDVNLNFEDLDGRKDYNKHRQYCRSKLANVLFTQELAQRLEKIRPNARVLSVHPGLVKTQMARELINDWGGKALVMFLYPSMWLFMKDCTSGSQTTLHTVYEKTENLKNGGYYNECKLGGVNPFAKDPQNQKTLWQRSEQMLGIKFPVN